MAGKKTKPRKTTKKLNFKHLKPSDVLCPICRTILIEPVTLPCNHAFCKLCFEGSMEKANLVCPMCRVRVGSWLRKVKKDAKLVDEELWEAIQTQYPQEVQNRYHGIDNVIEEVMPVIIVASPGEIRKEYEQERQRELEEQKKIREAEEKASASLINKLREEEEHRKKLEDEKLRLDAALARKLSQQLDAPTTSKFTPKKVIEIKKADGSIKNYGPMDKFIRIEETKPNRLSLNKSEEQRTLYKGGRRRISMTPNPNINFATKEYTCHVLDAESRSKDSTNSFSIFNNKSSYNNPGVIPTVQKKIRQARKIVETEERKSNCKSGYKSSESGSDDAIDQECKFYFKPIDTQKRYHVPGTIPLKVPSLKGKHTLNVCIKPPSGKIINLQLGTVISAFAKFSAVFQQNPRSQTPSPREVIEDEMTDRQVRSFNRLKRKLSEEDSPVKKKGRRHNYTRQIFQDMKDHKTVSSPFYGFDSESSRSTNNSPFNGFDASAIKKYNYKRDLFNKLIGKQEQSVIDNKSLDSTGGLYRSFKTYPRHQSRQFKASQDVKFAAEPLKLQILRTSKNGINRSLAIQNKLKELRSYVEESRNSSNKNYIPKSNIDINRNIPEVTLLPSRNNFAADDQIKSGLGLDCAGATISSKNLKTYSKNIKNCEDKSVKNASPEFRKVDDCFDNNKLQISSNDPEGVTIMLDSKKKNDLRKCVESNLETKSTTVDLGISYNISPKAINISHATNCRTKNTSLKTAIVSSKLTRNRTNKSDILNVSNNPTKSNLKSMKTGGPPVKTNLNGTWRTRQKKDSPKKVLNNLSKKDIGSSDVDSVVTNRFFSVAPSDRGTAFKSNILDGTSSHSVQKTQSKTRSAVKSDSDARNKNALLDDTSLHSVNKTFESETKTAVPIDTNSKITGTFFKVKGSSTKPKNGSKKLKSSPAKVKVNNISSESVQVNGELNEKQLQEQSDFEMARRLQAQFDSIQTPFTTRRGTKRQITLDEMLLV